MDVRIRFRQFALLRVTNVIKLDMPRNGYALRDKLNKMLQYCTTIYT
jgi:hypothetical protein